MSNTWCLAIALSLASLIITWWRSLSFLGGPSGTFTTNLKKLRIAQLLKKCSKRRKHCELAVVRRSQKFSPCRRPLPRVAEWPKFNQLEMVTTFTPLPTNPVWWGSMHAILSYRDNRPTHTQTNPHPRPITIHPEFTEDVSVCNMVCWSIDLGSRLVEGLDTKTPSPAKQTPVQTRVLQARWLDFYQPGWSSYKSTSWTDWNALPPSTRAKQSTDSSKKALYKLPDDSTYHCWAVTLQQ